MSSQFLLYGSYGYTGDLVARLAAARGLRPLLAGRDAKRLQAQAAELGLEYLALGLDDPAALDAALDGLPLALHCAGPFSKTSRPMADACLRRGAHYLDITGEIDVFEALAARSAEARQAGVMLLPGIGFDVVPSDCLAAHLKQRLPSANHLVLAIAGFSRASRGTTRTSLERLGQPGVQRLKGKLVPIPGVRQRTFDFGSGPRQAAAIGWGDVSTAYHSTGIPNIETYMALPRSLQRFMRWSARFKGLLSSRAVQGLLNAGVRLLPAGPSEQQRRECRSLLYGEVHSADGRRAAARLTTPEAYRLTAETAVLAVQKALAGAARPGFQTPSSAFGAGFVLEIDGVELQPL